MKSRTRVAVFVNLVGKILALRHRESLARKEIRLAREQADAVHAMPLRLGQQRFHQTSAAAFALRPGRDCDRANFGEVRAIQMQRAAADDATIIFEDDEVSDVFANFRQRARQQRAVAGVCRDQVVNLLVHRARLLYACAWTSSRRDSILFLATLIACRTRAGAVPPATSCTASTEASFSDS